MENSSQSVSPIWRVLSSVALLGFVATAIYWYFHIPSTGKGGVLLAVAASIMPLFWEKISTLERVFWIAMLFTLLGVEYRAINKDQQELAGKFQGIADQLNTSIQQNKTQFDATIKKAEDILDNTKRVAKTSEESLANISGEGSFPCIVPQSHSASETTIPLLIWNDGKKNNLTGVEVRILSSAEWSSEAQYLKLPLEVGTLPPIWGKPLLETVSPTLGTDGTAVYFAEIWDQTGFYMEVLHFRRGKYRLPWAYNYSLSKQGWFKSPKGFGGMPIAGCSSKGWSDDNGDGKPIPKNP